MAAAKKQHVHEGNKTHTGTQAVKKRVKLGKDETFFSKVGGSKGLTRREQKKRERKIPPPLNDIELLNMAKDPTKEKNTDPTENQNTRTYKVYTELLKQRPHKSYASTKPLLFTFV